MNLDGNVNLCRRIGLQQSNEPHRAAVTLDPLPEVSDAGHTSQCTKLSSVSKYRIAKPITAPLEQTSTLGLWQITLDFALI